LASLCLPAQLLIKEEIELTERRKKKQTSQMGWQLSKYFTDRGEAAPTAETGRSNP